MIVRSASEEIPKFIQHPTNDKIANRAKHFTKTNVFFTNSTEHYVLRTNSIAIHSVVQV
jgi:hypothetical protein